MWKSLRETACFRDAAAYGEELYRLSLLTHRLSGAEVAETVFLSSNYFEDYIQTRAVDAAVVDSCIKKLEQLQISGSVVVRLSVRKDCNMNREPLTVRVSPANLANALTGCFERWFDGKPYAYRCTHRMKPQETYPTVYLQPLLPGETYTVITRNSLTGNLLTETDYRQNKVHCTVPSFGSAEQQLVAETDALIAVPLKIRFCYAQPSGTLTVVHCERYPMKKEAFLHCLTEKYARRQLSGEAFLWLLDPDDLVRADGRTLVADAVRCGLGNGMGTAAGQIVFRTSDRKAIARLFGTQSYIFVTTDTYPGDTEILRFCQGALFGRGGMTSHGMTITRGFGIPAVTDTAITVDASNKRFGTGGEVFEEGDIVCIDSVRGVWAKNGSFIPSYRADLDNRFLSVVISVLQGVSKGDFSHYPLDFQMHVSRLANALKRIGYSV